MSSIMTNSAAMTALQTLQNINKSMETTQGRISTGYRVGTASDNAAYWSIATTMRSDNAALSTVEDALGLGAATVDVAYTAMEATKDVLDEIKTKLIAAKQPGIDKSKIQAEISQLQDQLTGNASGAVFSGNNWLSVDSSASGFSWTQSVVSSFSRDGSGSISIGTVDVDLMTTALFDASATGAGLLDAGLALAEDGGVQDVAESAGDGVGAAANVAVFSDVSAGVTLDDNDAITFDLVKDGTATTITINKSVVDSALSSTDGVIADATDMATVVTAALADAGVTGVTAAAATNAVVITHGTDAVASTLEITNAASNSNGNAFGVTDIDITSATQDELDVYIAGVDSMTETVTTAASDLGAVKHRIDMQQDFVSKLMDAIDRGIGQLVDADMNEESTRLQALQVQQQLGIQALSIANANSQNILSLFR